MERHSWTDRSIYGLALLTAASTAACVAARSESDDPSFDEFVEGAEQLPGDTVPLIDGDIPVNPNGGFQRLYEQLFGAPTGIIVNWGGRASSNQVRGESLAVNTINGQDDKWNDIEKKNLTYCVGNTFESEEQRETVVADMIAAAEAWEAVSDIDFIHIEEEDANCDNQNENVVFDVQGVYAPEVNVLARAFFPSFEREISNVVINTATAIEFPPGSLLTLEGILRHELGHVLGFRHEHTRHGPGGDCYEDSNYRVLTDANTIDLESVMHYPGCDGGNNQALTLSVDDAEGAAILYGLAGGGEIPENGDIFEEQSSVEDGYAVIYAGIVAAGSSYRVLTSGDGNVNLHTRLGAQPTPSNYDCAPLEADSAETCTGINDATVPSRLFVAVAADGDSNYSLRIEYVAP